MPVTGSLIVPTSISIKYNHQYSSSYHISIFVVDYLTNFAVALMSLSQFVESSKHEALSLITALY